MYPNYCTCNYNAGNFCDCTARDNHGMRLICLFGFDAMFSKSCNEVNQSILALILYCSVAVAML